MSDLTNLNKPPHKRRHRRTQSSSTYELKHWSRNNNEYFKPTKQMNREIIEKEVLDRGETRLMLNTLNGDQTKKAILASIDNGAEKQVIVDNLEDDFELENDKMLFLPAFLKSNFVNSINVNITIKGKQAPDDKKSKYLNMLNLNQIDEERTSEENIGTISSQIKNDGGSEQMRQFVRSDDDITVEDVPMKSNHHRLLSTPGDNPSKESKISSIGKLEDETHESSILQQNKRVSQEATRSTPNKSNPRAIYYQAGNEDGTALQIFNSTTEVKKVLKSAKKKKQKKKVSKEKIKELEQANFEETYAQTIARNMKLRRSKMMKNRSTDFSANMNGVARFLQHQHNKSQFSGKISPEKSRPLVSEQPKRQLENPKKKKKQKKKGKFKSKKLTIVSNLTPGYERIMTNTGNTGHNTTKTEKSQRTNKSKKRVKKRLGEFKNMYRSSPKQKSRPLYLSTSNIKLQKEAKYTKSARGHRRTHSDTHSFPNFSHLHFSTFQKQLKKTPTMTNPSTTKAKGSQITYLKLNRNNNLLTPKLALDKIRRSTASPAYTQDSQNQKNESFIYLISKVRELESKVKDCETVIGHLRKENMEIKHKNMQIEAENHENKQLIENLSQNLQEYEQLFKVTEFNFFSFKEKRMFETQTRHSDESDNFMRWFKKNQAPPAYKASSLDGNILPNQPAFDLRHDSE